MQACTFIGMSQVILLKGLEYMINVRGIISRVIEAEPGSTLKVRLGR